MTDQVSRPDGSSVTTVVEDAPSHDVADVAVDNAMEPDAPASVETVEAVEAEAHAAPERASPAPPSWSWPARAAATLTADESDAPPVDAASQAESAEITAVAEPRAPAGGGPVSPAPSLGPPGKRRSALAVVALSVVTLGVYTLVWHHRVNREVGNFDTRMHVHPGRSTLAVAIPWAAGWLVSLAGAARIVLSVLNVSLPFDPHFSVLQAYVLLGGVVLIPYLVLALPWSVVASVMTLERVRIAEDRLGRRTDAQLRPTRAILWLALPMAGGLVLVATLQSRLNRCWQDDLAAPQHHPARQL